MNISKARLSEIHTIMTGDGKVNRLKTLEPVDHMILLQRSKLVESSTNSELSLMKRYRTGDTQSNYTKGGSTKLPMSSNEKLVVTLSGSGVVVEAIASNFGVEKKIMVVVSDDVSWFSVESFGDQAKGLEFAEEC